MGLFGLFGERGRSIEAGTLLKRMTAAKSDWSTLVDDEERECTLANVWCPQDVHVTINGRSTATSLVPCNASKDEMLQMVKKGQREAYYVSPESFCLSFRLTNGDTVKLRAKFRCFSNLRFAEWVRENVSEPGKNYSEKDVSGLFDRFFPDEQSVVDFFSVESYEQSETVEAEDAPTLSIGSTVFGCYTIEKELGSGGMGKVFLASDKGTAIASRQKVVLKVLHDSLCADDKSRQQFIREANTLSAMRDDRIAACYGCRFLGSVPVLIMEYIEGISLDQYLIEKGGSISEDEARELLRPIAGALDYAHRKNIYHLDVKPLNIIVRNEPKDGCRTCLLDFGISKRAHKDGSMTMTMSLSGTRAYMSPEQWRGNEKPTSAMDVYALAVSAYECVKGEMPYPDGWKLDAKVEPFDSQSDFSVAVMRGLDWNPANRPATCAALVDPLPGSGKRVDGAAAGATVGESPESMVGSAAGNMPPPQQLRPSSLADLKRSIDNYRMMLAQSAKRCERDNAERAEWMCQQQARLRDLTKDLEHASEAAIAAFFNDVKRRIGEEGSTPDDFFAETVRLVELRNGLPQSGGRAWLALKESIK